MGTVGIDPQTQRIVTGGVSRMRKGRKKVAGEGEIRQSRTGKQKHETIKGTLGAQKLGGVGVLNKISR